MKLLSVSADKRRALVFVTVIVVVACIYFYSSFRVYGDVFKTTDVPYYNYLTSSLLQGRFDLVDVPLMQDLSLYNEKLYMYWGFTPVFFVLPFYLIGGIITSDVFYTLIAGLMSVVFFYLVVCEFDKYFKLNVSEIKIALLTLAFALASPNFYLSIGGRIWLTSQTISILYLLISLYFLFKYLNTKFKLIYLVLFAVCWSLAWLSRNTLFVYIFLYLFAFQAVLKSKREKALKHTLFVVLPFVFISIMFYLSYNYVRFGNIYETGITHQLAAGRYAEDISKGNLFSREFINNNVQHYIFTPAYLILEPPYIVMKHEGSSIFSVYTFTVLYLFVFSRDILKNKEKRKFLLVANVILVIILSFLLTYLGTGWKQFGSRYFFDAIPIIYICLMFVMPKIPRVTLWLLMIYGAVINYFGSLYSFAN